MSRKTGIRSLSINAGFLVFSRLAEKGIRFIYLLVLARFLEPDMLGLYNYGIAWYLIFLPLANWGLGELLSIYLGRNHANSKDIVGATFIIRLFATILFAVCCLIIGFLSNEDLISRTVIGIFIIALIGRSFAMWGRACFIAVEKSHYSAGLEVGFRFLEVVGGLGYLLLGGGVLGLCIIHSAFWVIEGIVALYLVRNRLSFRKILVPWSFLRPLAVEALPITINIFLLIALLQSGFVVLKHVSIDASALGFYAVAFQLIINTVFISEAFGQAALPFLSRANQRESGEQIVFLEAMIKICSFFSAVLILFVIVYDKSIVRLLFGQKYLAASDVLIICAISMITYYALPFANEVLRAGSENIVSAVNIAIALSVNIIVSILLVPGMGAKAPAIGLLVGASLALMLHLMAIDRRIGKISWWQAVIKPYIFVILAGSITWNLKEYGIIGLGAGVVVLGTCYSLWKIFTPQEMSYFTRLIPWMKQV